MATWPNVSPETQDLVAASEQVQQLVQGILEATQDYLDEWDQELVQLYSQTTRDPVAVLVELANSVQEAAAQLQRFRQDGLEYQQQQIADLMIRLEQQDDELKPGGKPA